MQSNIMNLPPASQQVSIIRNLEKTTNLTINESAYLISSKWLKNWKLAVGYSNFQPKDIMIPEIDNRELLSGANIRLNVSEGIDYEIITKRMWDQLYSWYKGGPEIQVNVEHDDVNKRNVAVIFKPTFQVYYRDGRRPFTFSIYQKIGHLKEIVCKSFDCDPSKSILCDFEDRVRNIALDDSQSLNYYHIVDSDHYLLLETQREDGSWITATHLTKTSTQIIPDQNEELLLTNSNSMQTMIQLNAEPGVCGIVNIGNSCYINAALQCLCHTSAVYDFFLQNDNWRLQINQFNKKGTGGIATEKFYEVMREMWSGNNFKISNGPRELKFTIGEMKAPQFAGTSQQDSHEFLMFLMDILHEDLNQAHPDPDDKAIMEPVFGDGTNDEETATRSWIRHKKIHDSFFVDNFHGLLRSRLICPNCHKTTIVFDPYMSLTVPLPIPRTLSPRFTFVPYDVTQPRIDMQLSVVTPATVLEYVEEISQKIQRKVKDIVFAERAPNSTILSWRQTISRNSQCFAFEIPPHNPESVFACARLVAPKNIKDTPVVTELDGIFLVEIPREDATPEEVQEACEKRFAAFWKPTPGGEAAIQQNPSLAEFKESLCEDPKNDFADGGRMKARAVIHPLLKLHFDRERHLKAVSSTPIEVLLNPEVIRDPMNFDWSMLRMRLIDDSDAEIERRKKVTLDECFNIFQRDEVLDVNNKWYCPHCRTFVCAKKKMELWNTPKIMIVHLKRFLHTASSHLKLDINVKFPNLFDVSPYIVGPKNENEMKYNLFGVIEHTGTLSGGHYTANAYHHIKKKWYFFNDDVTKLSRPAVVHSREGYVLFYLRADDQTARKMPKEKVIKTIDVTPEMLSQVFIPKIKLPKINIEYKPQKKPEKVPMRSQSASTSDRFQQFDVEQMKKNIYKLSEKCQGKTANPPKTEDT